MAPQRIRKASSRKEFESVIDDHITIGWEVIERGETTALMRKKTWGTGGGHIVVALLTAWWTLGVGNLLYALIKHYAADKMLVKLEQEATAQH